MACYGTFRMHIEFKAAVRLSKTWTLDAVVLFMKEWSCVLQKFSSLLIWIRNKRLNWQKREETKNIKTVFYILDMIMSLETMNTEWYIKINEKTYLHWQVYL